MYAMQFEKKINFIYDDSFNNNSDNSDSFQFFKNFYSSIHLNILLYDKEKTLSISFIDNKFSSEMIKSETDEILTHINNNFIIVSYYLNNNNRIKKIINIKNYLNDLFNFLNMEEVKKVINNLSNKIDEIKLNSNNVISNLDKQIKDIKDLKDAHEKEILKLKDKIKDMDKEQEKEIIQLNDKIKDMDREHEKEIIQLNDKINDLLFYEEKYFYLKGRFIFKSFRDYLFLIFGINIEMKMEEKKYLLDDFSKKNHINLKRIKSMIEIIRNE